MDSSSEEPNRSTAGWIDCADACEAGPDTPDALCTRLSEVMLGDGSVQDDVAIVVVAVT